MIGRLLSVILLLLAGTVYADSAEYEAKAKHLYQFAKHVQWPKIKALKLCIVGASPFGKALNQALQGHSVGGRRLQIKRLTPTQSVTACHLLFISQRLSPQQVKKILQAAPPHTLTVGEQSDFIRLGGIINFIIKNNKVRYEVNRSQAQKQGLKLGYRLVKHASHRY